PSRCAFAGGQGRLRHGAGAGRGGRGGPGGGGDGRGGTAVASGPRGVAALRRGDGRQHHRPDLRAAAAGRGPEAGRVAVKFLLDTNTCVHHLRHGAASPVTARLAGTSPNDVVLCSVVVAELLLGALKSRNVSKNLAAVRAFVSRFRSLPFGDREAEDYARVRADLEARGTPIGPNDLMIAAIALANGLTLVTHNTAEFSRVTGLTLDDWQVPPAPVP